MIALLQLAWRNLGRNRRRTALTTAAAMFASALTLTTLAIQKGSYERWIENTVRVYPGHYEVSLAGYREHRTLDYGMTLDADSRRELDGLSLVEGWAPRLESWALAMPDREGSRGRPAWLIGVDLDRESVLTKLGSSLEDARGSAAQVRGLVLGEVLARNLGVGAGDSVILIAADYYGSQSADRFPVLGTIEVGLGDFDGYAALIDLQTLQEFLEVGQAVSHVAFFVEDSDAVAPLGPQLLSLFPDTNYEILSWEQLVPEVIQLMLMDRVGGWLSLAVIIVVVGFGLLNTVLMSVFERVHEFGVLRALGLKPRGVFALVMLESFQLSLLGFALGFGVAVPLLLWLTAHPLPIATGELAEMAKLFEIDAVMEVQLSARQLVGTALALSVVALLAALPPAVRAARGRPVDALRET